MKIGLASLFLMMTFATTASATGGIFCKAVDGRSGEIYLSTGRLPILSILSAEVRAFGKIWSTEKTAENRIVVGQAFDDKTKLFVDFTDENIEEVLISLRTSKINTAKESGEAGVLRIGEAVYPVQCDSE